MPRGIYDRTGRVEAAEADLPQTPAFSAADVPAGKTHVTEPIEIERIPSMEGVEFEAFMQQPVEVHFHEPADENEPQFVQVGVNGVLRVCRRGETATWPRSHIAVLATARTERLQQQEIVNGDGSKGYSERLVSRLSYPFSVISDPAGRRGADWLKQMLTQRV